MTESSACAHCREALPWYAAGTASDAERASVELHLAACADCVHALAEWRALAGSVQTEGRGVEPALSFSASWERLSARLPTPAAAPAATPTAAIVRRHFSAAPAAAALWPSLTAVGGHLRQVVFAQARLLRPSVWIASGLAIALATLYALVLESHAGEQDVLALALPLIAATGIAFLYGPENDPGLELALATPTSARAVLVGRFALLFTYDALLALAGTVVLALVRGDGLWALTLVWLGPMALLSTVSLALSLVLSPAVAVGGALVLWLARTVRFDHGIALRITPEAFWHTTPQILAVSLVLLVFAILYVPRQERLAREEQLTT